MIGTNADMLPGNDWGNNVSREQIIWNKIYREHKHKSTNPMKRPQIVSNTELGIQKAIQWKISRGSKKLKRDRAILHFTGVVGGEGEGTDHAAMKRHWRPAGGAGWRNRKEVEAQLGHKITNVPLAHKKSERAAQTHASAINWMEATRVTRIICTQPYSSIWLEQTISLE